MLCYVEVEKSGGTQLSAELSSLREVGKSQKFRKGQQHFGSNWVHSNGSLHGGAGGWSCPTCRITSTQSHTDQPEGSCNRDCLLFTTDRRDSQIVGWESVGRLAISGYLTSTSASRPNNNDCSRMYIDRLKILFEFEPHQHRHIRQTIKLQ